MTSLRAVLFCLLVLLSVLVSGEGARKGTYATKDGFKGLTLRSDKMKAKLKADINVDEGTDADEASSVSAEEKLEEVMLGTFGRSSGSKKKDRAIRKRLRASSK